MAAFHIKHEKPSVCIVAMTVLDTVLLVRQYRPGPEAILLELPGGSIEENEAPEDAAKRELLEETGYQGQLQFVGNNFHCAYSDTKRYNFAAHNCVRVQDPNPDMHEFIEVIELSLDAFRQHIRNGQLTNVEGAYMVLDALSIL